MISLSSLAGFLIEQIKRYRKILFIASPGFGKSRAIPYICERALRELKVEKVLVLTRSYAEIVQLVQFFRKSTPNLATSLGLIAGRERVCPFRARTSFDCVLLRSDGVCQLWRVNRDVAIALTNVDSLDLAETARKLSVCPYDLMLAKSKQSKVVIASYLYFSNVELAKTILRILDTRDVLLIIDEAHGILTGLENVQKFPLSIFSNASSRLSKLVTDLDLGEEVIFQPAQLDLDKVKSGSEKRRELAYAVEILLNLACSDLISLRKLEGELEVKSYAIRPIVDLLNSVHGVILFTASVTPELASSSPVTRGFKIIQHRDKPSRFCNLTVYIVHDVELTLQFRESRAARTVITSVISSIMTKLPLVGGIALVFSSRDFLKTHVDHVCKQLRDEIVLVMYDKSECDKTLQEFKSAARRERAVLITYAGSPLMEGVNFLLDELICVVLFGFPYPEFNAWNEAKRRFLSSLTRKSFTLTYLLPAVSTSVQCIGRVTRDLDRRVKYAVLVDSRFRRFLRYFPSWIRCRAVLTRLSEFEKTFGEVFPLC